MSQENIEVVRRTLEAWQNEDFAVWLSGCDPNIEWRPVLERLVEGPESIYRGHDGVRRLWHSYRTELENLRSKRKKFATRGQTAFSSWVCFGGAERRAG